MASGWVEARGDGISITAVIATRGGQMPPKHWGGGNGGSSRGGGGGKNNHGMADNNVADVAAWRGGGRHYMWKEEQIEQFAYLIRSGEGKRHWVINNYKFEDARNPTMAAAVDSNKDNNHDNNNNRQTSSAWSNFIVTIHFHTLLYCF
jgi:hypothetical protein